MSRLLSVNVRCPDDPLSASSLGHQAIASPERAPVENGVPELGSCSQEKQTSKRTSDGNASDQTSEGPSRRRRAARGLRGRRRKRRRRQNFGVHVAHGEPIAGARSRLKCRGLWISQLENRIVDGDGRLDAGRRQGAHSKCSVWKEGHAKRSLSPNCQQGTCRADVRSRRGLRGLERLRIDRDWSVRVPCRKKDRSDAHPHRFEIAKKRRVTKCVRPSHENKFATQIAVAF